MTARYAHASGWFTFTSSTSFNSFSASSYSSASTRWSASSRRDGMCFSLNSSAASSARKASRREPLMSDRARPNCMSASLLKRLVAS